MSDISIIVSYFLFIIPKLIIIQYKDHHRIKSLYHSSAGTTCTRFDLKNTANRVPFAILYTI
jgi:hypothetical protein